MHMTKEMVRDLMLEKAYAECVLDPETGCLNLTQKHAERHSYRTGNGRVHLAPHVLAWEAYHGHPRPYGKRCFWTCGNSCCINPEHITTGRPKRVRNKYKLPGVLLTDKQWHKIHELVRGTSLKRAEVVRRLIQRGIESLDA